jgi:hypothetical protein
MTKEYSSDELAEWFKTKALNASSSVARNKLLRSESRFINQGSTFVGNLYFFRYDPKLKNVLPMYDKYPMALIVDHKEDGFTALNMHYLSGPQRRSTINMFKKSKMKNYSSNSNSNYEALSDTVAGFEIVARQAFKRYLWNHVRSQFIFINSDEYDKAIQLPVAEWVFKR